MMNKIKNFIYEETLNTYDQDCYSSEDLKQIMQEYEAEIELALDCYYRLEEEEIGRDVEIWGMYDSVRQFNQPIIDALKTILRERGDL